MNLLDKLKEDTILHPLQSSTQAEAIQGLLVHLQKFEVLSVIAKLQALLALLRDQAHFYRIQAIT